MPSKKSAKSKRVKENPVERAEPPVPLEQRSGRSASPHGPARPFGSHRVSRAMPLLMFMSEPRLIDEAAGLGCCRLVGAPECHDQAFLDK